MYKVIVRRSRIHDKGLFAAESIPKGAIVIEYTGEKITKNQETWREYKNDKTGVTYILSYNDEYSIDGAKGGNESIFANHSCDPTVYPLRRNGKIYFVSTRAIKKGEEITFDYAYDDPEDPQDRTICKCGSKKCRGFINIIKNSR